MCQPKKRAKKWEIKVRGVDIGWNMCFLMSMFMLFLISDIYVQYTVCFYI